MKIVKIKKIDFWFYKEYMTKIIYVWIFVREYKKGAEKILHAFDVLFLYIIIITYM